MARDGWPLSFIIRVREKSLESLENKEGLLSERDDWWVRNGGEDNCLVALIWRRPSRAIYKQDSVEMEFLLPRVKESVQEARYAH